MAYLNIVIRPFSWDDWTALWILRGHQLAEHGIVTVPEEVVGPPDLSSPYEQDFHRMDQVYLAGKGNFWLAWVDDVPVGYVGAEDVGRAIELRRMYVWAAYRRRGIGRLLVQILLDHCLAEGINAVELWTDEDGPGRYLYARLGFEFVLGPGAEFQSVPVRKDEVRMRRDLHKVYQG